MSPIEHLLELLERILHYLHIVPIVIFFIVGIVVAAKDIAERLADYFERLRDKEHRYRVRTTIVKDLMGETETQTAKLRRLRVSKSTNKLILDPWPSIIPVDSEQERKAKLAQFFSVPGRLGLQTETDEDTGRPATKFLVNLSRDEELRAHHEYSTLLVYTLDETLDDILGPPEFIAAQPVGEECFTYEVHFPPQRRFVRRKSVKDKPRIRCYKGPIAEGKELRYESYTRQNKSRLAWHWTRFINRFRTRYHVLGGRTDFGDRLGTHDWFRVTVLKPPKKEDIHICWCMEGDPIGWKWCAHKADEHKKT